MSKERHHGNKEIRKPKKAPPPRPPAGSRGKADEMPTLAPKPTPTPTR